MRIVHYTFCACGRVLFVSSQTLPPPQGYCGFSILASFFFTFFIFFRTGQTLPSYR
jgi:hypothetical protein